MLVATAHASAAAHATPHAAAHAAAGAHHIVIVAVSQKTAACAFLFHPMSTVAQTPLRPQAICIAMAVLGLETLPPQVVAGVVIVVIVMPMTTARTMILVGQRRATIKSAC